ncbi:Protein CBG25962 [Caenorhabditis briggsae]|uniref:Protein CBG25962 n=1 Tax=Caenorhabditis briggsae TaxID=6238 RepID=B6IKR2_CAEBR|nr:Protein CBG25962 [Caenorhabditis briggsae]CAS00492.1 Protein CBG25962 [Caenorhabditis briggsae]
MTIQRLVILLFPTKNKLFFEKRLIIYCSIIMLVSFIILLIPYLSDCAVSFHAYPIDFASSCGLGRHPVSLIRIEA